MKKHVIDKLLAIKTVDKIVEGHTYTYMRNLGAMYYQVKDDNGRELVSATKHFKEVK